MSQCFLKRLILTAEKQKETVLNVTASATSVNVGSAVIFTVTRTIIDTTDKVPVDLTCTVSPADSGTPTIELSDDGLTALVRLASVNYPKAYTFTFTGAESDKYGLATATATCTGQRIKVTIPSLSNTNIAVTGSSVSPTINNYNSSLMNQSGTTSTSSIGTWTITWSLKDTNKYCWTDSSTSNKSATWKTYGGTKAVLFQITSASKSSTTSSSITYMYRNTYWNVSYGATFASLKGKACNTPFYQYWNGAETGNSNSSTKWYVNGYTSETRSGVTADSFRVTTSSTLADKVTTHRLYDSSNNSALITSASQTINLNHTYVFKYLNISGAA